MRLLLLIETIFLFACLCSAAQAKLGETLDQTIALYGQPIPEAPVAPPKGIGEQMLLFQQNGFSIVVVIYNGTVAGEVINKNDKSTITPSEKRDLLASEANDGTWIKSDSSDANKYVRDDRNAYATSVSHSHQMCFFTRDYYDALQGISPTSPVPPALVATGVPAVVVGKDLVTKDGRIYRNYKFVGCTFDSLDIVSGAEDQIVSIPFTNLPPDLQKKYDPDLESGAWHDEYIQSERQIAGLVAPYITNASEAYSQAHKGTVDGQVFIVTQEGESIKLGAVHVLLYSADELTAMIVPRQAEFLKQQHYRQKYFDNQKEEDHETFEKLNSVTAMPAMSEIEGRFEEETDFVVSLASQLNALASSESYFQDLPAPLADSETDADGKFSISVPTAGPFVLVAKAERPAEGERYYWMVSISMNGETSKSVLLNNENMTTSGSSNSLIKCSK